MSANADQHASREERVNAVIAEYLEAVDAGRTSDYDNLLVWHRLVADDL